MPQLRLGIFRASITLEMVGKCSAERAVGHIGNARRRGDRLQNSLKVIAYAIRASSFCGEEQIIGCGIPLPNTIKIRIIR